MLRGGRAAASLTSAIPYGGATTRSRSLGSMRLTEFNEVVAQGFGAAYGASVLADHVLTNLGGRTAAQAIEDGFDPRDVWRALCVDFEVPRHQWWAMRRMASHGAPTIISCRRFAELGEKSLLKGE